MSRYKRDEPTRSFALFAAISPLSACARISTRKCRSLCAFYRRDRVRYESEDALPSELEQLIEPLVG